MEGGGVPVKIPRHWMWYSGGVFGVGVNQNLLYWYLRFLPQLRAKGEPGSIKLKYIIDRECIQRQTTPSYRTARLFAHIHLIIGPQIICI